MLSCMLDTNGFESDWIKFSVITSCVVAADMVQDISCKGKD